MADVFARTTGQWALTSTWNTSALPTVNDDVYANGFTITISAINPRVLTIRNTAGTGIAAGGSFTLTNGVSLTAGVVTVGSTACLTYSENTPSTCTLYGNLCALNGTVAQPLLLTHSGTGTLTIYGTAVASVNNGTNPQTNLIATNGNLNFIGDIYSSAIGSYVTVLRHNGPTLPVNITGNIFAIAKDCVVNANTGIINVFGNVYGGSSGATSAYGAVNSSTGVIYISGNVYGGTVGIGAYNSSTGSIYVQGTVTGGIGGIGIANNSTGLISATKVIGNDYGLGSVGIGSVVGMSNTQNGKAYVEQVQFGSRGQTPISGPVYILPSNQNTLTGYTTALGQTVTFYNSLSVSNLLPPTSSVRLGTVYNVGNSTGTMAVPLASAVQFGVAVDNTTGIAALQPQDVWGYSRLSATQVNSLGDRLRNVATTQSVGQQIASFNL